MAWSSADRTYRVQPAGNAALGEKCPDIILPSREFPREVIHERRITSIAATRSAAGTGRHDPAAQHTGAHEKAILFLPKKIASST